MLSTSTSSRGMEGQTLCLVGYTLVGPWPSPSPVSGTLKRVIGVLHPLIHLGFGTEFQQPAIVAEALGQTAIHSPWLDRFFPAVDEAAKQDQNLSKAFVTILDDIFADKELSTAACWDDKDLTRDGVFARAWSSMIKHASRWRVDSSELEEKNAEIANAAGKI